MKRTVLVLIAATLGLSVPASASAQRYIRDLVDQVQQAQNQGRDNGPGKGNRRGDDNRGSDNRGNDNRGNDNRGGGNDNRGGGNDYRRGGPQPGESWRPPTQSPIGREISMSQAIRIVEQSAGPGHHLDGNREERGGRVIYRIQWATDRGERRDYIVDAQTGAILGGR